MIAQCCSPNRSRQYGFTLVEILVAALVLSVGLLGLAGLQAVSLKMNQGSYLRVQATNLAYEIADAMRANIDRTNAATAAASVAAYESATSSVACDTAYVRPTSGLVKDNDIAEWRNRLACLLPSGGGGIAVTSNTTVTITVTWDETRQGGGTESFTFTTEL
ncbi:type IV pilus modification protein PilV [Thioflavicoccus mobilis 8321]|uniref:Type IV pilus modification protein PilV n=1 Tax=Thioflavicoccus mobilis 8321 TaxID=765912 RepID=L0GYJ5_9GAMM|nr:type IV pilus modification protein PilV [Thioflavicoccus mobilis]AGA91848.1 type IV pilus modification protein PilV [Thioflavicoccus mobilis 8321]